MSGAWIRPTTIAAAVGAGLVGGLFATFSTVVVPALRRLPADRAVGAMQAMNRTAPAPWVVVGLIGTGGACAALAVEALGHLDLAASRWRLTGAVLYLSTVVITIGFHVPRNDRLDAVGTDGPDVGAAWNTFVGAWAAGNHVRAVLATAAAAALTYAATLG